MRAVSVTVSVAFIPRESRVRLPNQTFCIVCVSTNRNRCLAHAHAHRLYAKNTFFAHNLKRQLALDMRRNASLIDTCVRLLLLVSRLKTNDTKIDTYQRLRHRKRISLVKPITHASWTYLLQVHGIVLPDWDVRTNTRGLCYFYV